MNDLLTYSDQWATHPVKQKQTYGQGKNDGVYEYVAVYVKDLLIAARDPEGIESILREEHKFKLKGVGTLSYHLECDYFWEEDRILCYGSGIYITKMIG
jgi:hypothetical protein